MSGAEVSEIIEHESGEFPWHYPDPINKIAEIESSKSPKDQKKQKVELSDDSSNKKED